MKTALITTIFATLVVAGNWHYEKTIVVAHGSTRVSFDGAALAILVSLVAGFLLARASYRIVRACLDSRIRIPRRSKFVDWTPCCLLGFLLFHWGTISTQSLPGSAVGEMKIAWGYGSDLSFYALILAASAIVLYQIHAGLSAYAKARPEPLV